ncbi:type IV toxin-antitoxin system AbiEi family antitoxin, partial [Rhizobium ruizarguesonis]
SSPSLTALDILRYSRGADGLDNIFTVLRYIAPQIDFESLTNLSRVTERPVVQRLGYASLRYRSVQGRLPRSSKAVCIDARCGQ